MSDPNALKFKVAEVAPAALREEAERAAKGNAARKAQKEAEVARAASEKPKRSPKKKKERDPDDTTLPREDRAPDPNKRKGRDEPGPALPAPEVRTLELCVVYKNMLCTRHGVVAGPTREGFLALLPGAFWMELSLGEHEPDALTVNEIMQRMVFVPPAPLRGSCAAGFQSVFVDAGFMQLPPGFGAPMIAIIGKGNSLKTSLLVRFWRMLNMGWVSSFEPVYTCQTTTVCRVIRCLRFAHLTGKLIADDGLRALLFGAGGLRKSGMRAESILDFSALSAACGNSFTTCVPSLDPEQLKLFASDMETAQQVQLFTADDPVFDKQRNSASIAVQARGRAAATRSVDAGVTIRVDETDWVLGQALQLLPPRPEWSAEGQALYANIFPKVVAHVTDGYVMPKAPDFERAAVVARQSTSVRAIFPSDLGVGVQS